MNARVFHPSFTLPQPWPLRSDLRSRRFQLTELMFDHGVGVAAVNSYAVKCIDSDFFSEEDEPTGLGRRMRNSLRIMRLSTPVHTSRPRF
jgi:hypothetical protein